MTTRHHRPYRRYPPDRWAETMAAWGEPSCGCCERQRLRRSPRTVVLFTLMMAAFGGLVIGLIGFTLNAFN